MSSKTELDFYGEVINNNQRHVKAAKRRRSMNYRKLILHTRNNALLENEQLASAALGIAGEAGEVADVIKKHLFHGHDLDRKKLLKELGDVRYYMEWILLLVNSTITEVEEMNTNKLMERYSDGFSKEASVARKDVKPE